MTGLEHYAEAERLLMRCSNEGGDVDPENAATVVAAQVHATLALAAATAYPALVAYTGDERGIEGRGWVHATAPRVPS